MKTFLKLLFLLILATLYAQAELTQDEIERSIVKIFTVSKNPNYLEPWNSTTSQSSGSGSIIAGNHILTNAHVVANQTFLEVKKYGDTKRYQAKVLKVSHETDLALLEVEEQKFFEGTKPLDFGTLPNIQDRVTVYGYPMGGNTISVSRGIVSRIEHNQYAHSGENFLAIQIDAAINPGNSGGPAISDGKIVGVVMQQLLLSQNIGYMVPIGIVEHFLKDIGDGTYDGFPKLGIYIKNLENETLRSYHHLDDNRSGVLLIEILYGSPFEGVLFPEDIITAINGERIENDGTVAFRENQYTSFKYLVDNLQVDDNVTLDILREGKEMRLHTQMKKTEQQMRFDKLEYDQMPNYFIYGGYVFTPLTKNLLQSSRLPLLDIRYHAERFPTKEKQEIVLLLKVLASGLNRGDHDMMMWEIVKVNGQSFKDFKEFYHLVENFQGDILILEDQDGAHIAIDRKEALAVQDTILERYSIKSSVSDRLLTE